MQLRRSILIHYLKSKGIEQIKHIKNGSLLDHFLRVETILKEWELDESVALFALAHSIYGTTAFKTKLVNLEERDAVQKIVGTECEKLIYLFSILQRETLTKKDNTYSFISTAGAHTVISRQEFKGLLHLLLANQLDHMNVINYGQVTIYCNTFLQFEEELTPKARNYLSRLNLHTSAVTSKEDMVSFIGHAGVWSRSNGHELVVDPWLYSSTHQKPLLRSFYPTEGTIDYMIPEPVYSIDQLRPDIILISHFHTHHSPFEEIKTFISRKKTTIICPPIPEKHLRTIEESLGKEHFLSISFIFCEKDAELWIDDFYIRVLTQPLKNHLCFFVETSNHTTFLHIADGQPNEDTNSLNLSPTWEKFYGMCPNILFLASAGHSMKHIHGIEKTIIENATLSPNQAAKLTNKIKPQSVGLIGIYNFSIWDSKIEYSPPSYAIQEHFDWAMTFINPSITIHHLKPGFVLRK